MKTQDYTAKQNAARTIESLANTDRWNDNTHFEANMDKLGAILDKIAGLDCFAAKIAKTVSESMNPYAKKVAFCSNKQAWILACAAVENNIEL